MLNPYQEQTSFTEAMANAFISLVNHGSHQKRKSLIQK